MPHSNNSGVSRRAFISRSVATAAAITAGATVSAASAATGRKWSKEADVLIVGSGAAAMAAAVGVVQAGSSVILLEKAAAAGGTTIKSDGAYWIPNNHLMKAKGMLDPKDDAMRYMASASYPLTYRAEQPLLGLQKNEYALIEAFYDNAAPTIEALEAVGAIQSTMVELVDYYDHSPDNKAPRGRILLPKAANGKYGNGRELIRQFRAWLTAKQVPILFRHAVGDVVKNKEGEVIGLQANGPDGPVFIRAKRAVIFGDDAQSPAGSDLRRVCGADQPRRPHKHRDPRRNQARQHGERLARAARRRGGLAGPERVARYLAAAGRQHDSREQVRHAGR